MSILDETQGWGLSPVQSHVSWKLCCEGTTESPPPATTLPPSSTTRMNIPTQATSYQDMCGSSGHTEGPQVHRLALVSSPLEP